MLCRPMKRLQDKEKIHSSFPQEEHKSKYCHLVYFFTLTHGNVGNFGCFSYIHIFLAYFFLYNSPVSLCYKEYKYSTSFIIISLISE